LTDVLDETSAMHRFIFDLWRRGVPPRRVSREVWKEAGRAGRQLIATWRSVVETFGPPPSEEEWAMAEQAELLTAMPADHDGVLEKYDRPTLTPVSFEPFDAAADLLRRYCELSPGRGTHRVYVWFQTLSDQHRAHVMLGTEVLGVVEMALNIWDELRRIEASNLYADGFLSVQIRNGTVETGELMCCHPSS
jgi:hypothetical protein